MQPELWYPYQVQQMGEGGEADCRLVRVDLCRTYKGSFPDLARCLQPNVFWELRPKGHEEEGDFLPDTDVLERVKTMSNGEILAVAAIYPVTSLSSLHRKVQTGSRYVTGHGAGQYSLIAMPLGPGELEQKLGEAQGWFIESLAREGLEPDPALVRQRWVVLERPV